MSDDSMAFAIAEPSGAGSPSTTPEAVSYSGRFVARLPPSLHRDLVRCAEDVGVSLNEFATVALARPVGWREQVSASARD